MDKTTETAVGTPVQEKGSALLPKGFFNPHNLAEAMQLARELSKSDIVPQSFKGKPENILIAIGMGMEVGLNPFQALQSIYVVNGRPSLWGDAVLGIVQQSGLCDYLDESYDPKTQTATCRTKRKGDPIEVVRSFSVEDAKKARLWTKEGPWQSYPVRMLQMRARSWAVRDKYSDLLKGLQIKEEIEDIISTTGEPVEMLPARKSEIAGATPSNDGATSKGAVITEADRKALAELAIDKGITPDVMKKWLKEKFGVDSSKDLPKDKMAELCNLIQNGEEPDAT